MVISHSGAPDSAAANSEDDAVADDREAAAPAERSTWRDSEAVRVLLDGDAITAEGGSVIVDGTTATIISAGTYCISGLLADGQIVVDTKDEATVTLVLGGVDIRSSTSAPIYVASAEQTVIVLADGAENHVADGESYVQEDPDEDEPNAAIFSKDDLIISGGGSLTVEGSYNDGIASKDGLTISGGSITVTSVDDGIRGKDYVLVQGGHTTVNAQGDGIKSDEDEDATLGYIAIEAGDIDITCGGDALQAQTDVLISGGQLSLTSGGGSKSRIDDSLSAKGIKAAVRVVIDGGSFTINSADDGVHSNGSLVVNGGRLVIASGDDGMHADATLDINDGVVNITESYEGIESAVITLNGGDIHVKSSDDGLNGSTGNGGIGPAQGPLPGPGQGRGGMRSPPGAPGQGGFGEAGGCQLFINGGHLVVDAGGDGIDVNGSVGMTAGVVIVNGPTQNMNGALDHMSFSISGGFLVAVGSSGMAQAPGQASSQNSVLLNLNTAVRAGTLVHIQNKAWEDILTFEPTKQYQSVVLSSPELIRGATYDVYVGGSSTGTASDGLYVGGTYTGGTAYTSFTVSSVVTSLGGGFRR